MHDRWFAALLILPMAGCDNCSDLEDDSDSLRMGGIFWAEPDTVVVPVDAEVEIELFTEAAGLTADETVTAYYIVEYDGEEIAPPGTSGGVLGGPSTYRVLARGALDRFELAIPMMAELEKRTLIWRCVKAGRTTIFITGEIDIGGGSKRPPLLNQTEMKLETVTVFCGDPPPDGGATDAGDGVVVDGGGADGGASAFAVQTVARTGDEIMGTNAVVGEIQLHGIDDSGKVTFIHSVNRVTNVLEEDDRGLRLAVTEGELERVLGPYTFRVIEDLLVTKAGDVVLTTTTDAGRCVVKLAQGTLTKILCDGDSAPVSGSTGPIDLLSVVAANDGALVLTFRADLLTGGMSDGNRHWVHHRGTTFTTIVRVGDPQPVSPVSKGTVEQVSNVVLGAGDQVALTTRTIEADIDHAVWTLQGGLRSRNFVNYRDREGSITLPEGTVGQYPFGVSPFDGVTVRGGHHGVVVNFLDGMGGGLPLSGIETDDLVFRNLPFENELPGAGQAVTWFNNLPRLQYQLVNDCDADDCAFVFAAGVDGSQTGVWRQPKSDGGAAAPPELLLWPGTQVPGLAAGVLVQQIGGMVVSDAGTVAVVAKVTGPGIRSAPDGDLPTNDGVVLAITPDQQLTLVVQMGDVVDLGLGPAPIDLIDLHNRAVGIPYVDVDFLGRNTRDQHVSHGSGIDGYNTTFNGRGCGQLLMRLGRFFTNSYYVLQRVTLPCN